MRLTLLKSAPTRQGDRSRKSCYGYDGIYPWRHGHLDPSEPPAAREAGGLKERMKAKTFEELFRRLLERPRPSPWERFGAHPDMKPFEHRDWRPHSEAGRGEWGA